MDEASANGKELTTLISAPRQSMLLLLSHFDMENDNNDDDDDDDHATNKWVVNSQWYERSEEFGDGEEAMALRETHQQTLSDLQKEIRALHLPGNTIDLIIDGLGGTSEVAEMSSRSHRMVSKNGEWKVERRPSNSNANNAERRQFQEGKKKYAIITAAASAGISLHADRNCANQAQRTMVRIL